MTVHTLLTRLRRGRRDERGDVPGWVMIAVMSAGIVALLAGVAGPALRDMFLAALETAGG